MVAPLVIAGAVAVAGSVVDAIGGKKNAKIAKAVGKMRNLSAQQNALEIVAAGQRRGLEEKRQSDILASRALAVAAAGGGNPDDPTISKIISDINGEGAYRAAVAMYEAESLSDKALYEGKIAEAGGEQSAKNITAQSAGSLLNAAGSLYKGIYG